ncbi:MAG: hypothetical protein IT258_14345 [Saprospiraceae bacterium]|nr:hypothetical protein [Saprospiraceae bacterium]
MKTAYFYISGALLLGLLLLGFGSAARLSSHQYCNGRFSYCLDYPTSLFPHSFIAADEDSLLFKTADELSELSVIASLDSAKQDSHLAFEQRLRALIQGRPYNILSIINGDDYYEVNFLFDGHWYHQKAGFFPTYNVLYTAKVPVNRTEMMMRFKEEVRIEF